MEYTYTAHMIAPQQCENNDDTKKSVIYITHSRYAGINARCPLFNDRRVYI